MFKFNCNKSSNSSKLLPNLQKKSLNKNMAQLMYSIPGGNRTHNYSLGENCYIHLTTGTSVDIFGQRKWKRVRNKTYRNSTNPCNQTIPLKRLPIIGSPCKSSELIVTLRFMSLHVTIILYTISPEKSLVISVIS